MPGRIRRGSLDLVLEPGETVLEGLLRGGAAVPSSCRAGACQACMQRAAAGDPGAASQQGLHPALREQGWFLACVSRPTGDLTIADGEPPAIGAAITEVTPIGPAIVRVRLEPDEALSYRPGQYVQLIQDDQIRAYSLASSPVDGPRLDLHVRVHRHGRVSRWLAGAAPGARVRLRGPAGSCFYTEGRPEQPLLMVGTGTGLAPLYAIARDARRRGHTGPISLVHGARDPDGFYLVDELKRMVAEAGVFRYVRCAMTGEIGGEIEVGDLAAVTLRLFPNLKGWRVFLCGSPDWVNALKKQCFLRGAGLKDISTDAFLTAPTPAPPRAAVTASGR
ncbi:FAD-binding oxidoreductase [Nannocystis pusilla]|uniref:2Fe-2S iron-sulfur cluster binding domain-containing protein n=1 Tax=Nannocystis pusilla TaxID=889268 RepID=A0ABS7TVZ8_9BACT|nr:FAD-binding oxidoreductase [Nannocystis pusilla]MBZ5712437.1 2Fe-2S iron-sulfur cluster binding domain-containing protein [Nannocystis pusilla]